MAVSRRYRVPYRLCLWQCIIIRTMWHGIDLPGYASLLSAVLFIGGIQLIGLGVMGEYIGRIYMETKGRPVYIVESDSDKAHSDTP